MRDSYPPPFEIRKVCKPTYFRPRTQGLGYVCFHSIDCQRKGDRYESHDNCDKLCVGRRFRIGRCQYMDVFGTYNDENCCCYDPTSCPAQAD